LRNSHRLVVFIHQIRNGAARKN